MAVYGFDQTAVGGTVFGTLNTVVAATGTTLSTGWTVSTYASGNYSKLDIGVTRAKTTFAATALPISPPDAALGDAFRTADVLTGSFAAGNWSFSVPLISSVATGTGALVARVYRSTSIDGSSGLTEITSAAQQFSTYTDSTAGVTTTLTWAAPAVTLAGEYLFVQFAYRIITASRTSTATVQFGSGGSVTTTAFTVIINGSASPASVGSVSSLGAVSATGTSTVSVAGYAYKAPVTIDHTKVSGGADLSDFPVLVSVTLPAAHVTSASGYDIVFTANSAGTVALDWEIESYNATTGELLAWVRIPTLSASVDTVIYAFYGNSAVTTDQSNKAGVWSATHSLVEHFGDGTTLSAADSSGNTAAGTITGATATAGQVGGAASFPGGTSNIKTGLTSVATQRSYRVWANRTATGQSTYARLFEKLNDAILFYSSSSRLKFQQYFSGGVGAFEVAVPASGQYHIAVTCDASSAANTPLMYVNGILAAFTASSLTSGAMAATANQLMLGNMTALNRDLVGSLDEFLVSDAILSAAWIKTEYNAQSSPTTFAALGTETSTGSGSVNGTASPARVGTLTAIGVALAMGSALASPARVGTVSQIGAASATGITVINATATPARVSSASATGSATAVGTVVINGTSPVTGLATSTAIGAVTGTGSAARVASGVSSTSATGATTASGTTVINGTASATGVASSTSVGTATAAVSATASPSGIATSSAAGAASASVSVVASPAGRGTTSVVGSVTASGTAVINGTAPASGVSSASAIGAATASGATVINGTGSVTGLTSTSATHNVTGSGSAIAPASGVGTASSVGTSTASGSTVGNSTAIANGVSSASAIHAPAATGSAIATITGRSTTSAIAAVSAQATSIIDATATVSGVTSSSTVNAPSATGSATALTGSLGTTSTIGTASASGTVVIDATAIATGVTTTSAVGSVTATGAVVPYETAVLRATVVMGARLQATVIASPRYQATVQMGSRYKATVIASPRFSATTLGAPRYQSTISTVPT